MGGQEMGINGIGHWGDRGGFRAGNLEEFFHILAQNIPFYIHGIPRLQILSIGCPIGVGNDGDLEVIPLGGAVGDR